MFEALRKMIFPIIIIVLVFFVAMIILQWGMQMSGQQAYEEANVAGYVNGEEISWQAYNRIYSNLVQQELAKDPDLVELPDNKAQELQEQAWNQVLGERLMMQQVAKHQVAVTDEEVYEYLKFQPPTDLQTHPYFLTDGQFDYQKYLSALADPNMSSTWASMEPFIRQEIKKMKVQEMLIQTAEVSEAEVKQTWMEASERVKVGMINVAYERFSSPPPQSTDEEYMAYYEANKDEYTHPERAGLNVIAIEKKPGRYDWEAAHVRIKALYDSVMAGADFKALAFDLSEDVVSARDSGSLGWFSQGRMVEEFDRLAFSMEDGDVSEPIRTQFGYHIIRHHGYRDTTRMIRGEKQTVKEANCSHILLKAQASQETLDNYYNRIIEFEQKANEIGFLAAAEELQLPAQPSGLFERSRPGDNSQIGGVGQNKQIENFAFEHEVGAISPVVETPNGFFCVEVSARVGEGISDYEEVKDRVRMGLQKQKVITLCSDTANAIWTEIESGTEPRQAAEMYGEEYETPSEFGRTSFVRGLQRSPEAIGAAFSLRQPGEMTPPVEHDQGVVIFELIERISPDIAEYTAMRDSIRTTILQSKQQELFARWYDNLVNSSEIVNNTTRLQESQGEYY